MRGFIAILQAYERETGRSFQVSLRVAARTPDEARTLTLEEAVTQGLTVAVVHTLHETNLAPPDTAPCVIAISPRRYLDEENLSPDV